ncbi:hypothetical protein HPB49_024945 [Dermacentor silvarum]|uniref:Uncharacterized protein n=1 Tax=Dermacentor silvarum TaxID=543639 RepID=A0ACB8DHE3_DERSI|nr:hypothetical protein HPB49_024945 [Dermacentor silvarum]
MEDLPVVKPYCDKCGRNNPERWLPRLPYNMLFVVGGWSMGQPLSAIEAFDPCADRWVHHKNESIFEPRAPKPETPGHRVEDSQKFDKSKLQQPVPVPPSTVVVVPAARLQWPTSTSSQQVPVPHPPLKISVNPTSPLGKPAPVV